MPTFNSVEADMNESVSPSLDTVRLGADGDPYRELLESVPVGIVVHRGGEVVFANYEAARIAGTDGGDQLLGRSVLDFAHPEDRELISGRIQQAAEGRGRVEPTEIRIRRDDGATVHVETRALPISYRDEDAVLTLVRDISERVQAERALVESEERYRRLFEEVQDAVYISDPDGRILDVNPAAEELFGYCREELLNLDARELYVDPGERDRWKETLESAGTVKNFELRLRRKDGREMVCLETATLWMNSDGEALGYQGIIRDVTERREFEEELEHRALHDPLTDLPNRSLFWDRLEHSLARSDRRGGVVAVLFADLDEFKEVNDSLGHAAGDRVLTLAARRLRDCFRDEDTVARVGGDEFTVLLESVAGPGQAAEAAERLLWLLQEPFRVDGQELGIGASVGIALHSPADEPGNRHPGEIADVLVSRADGAMYRAKEAGGNRYVMGNGEEGPGPGTG